MRKISYLSIITFYALISTLWGQAVQRNQTVAVLDFEGQGVSKGEVQTLTERLLSLIHI